MKQQPKLVASLTQSYMKFETSKFKSAIPYAYQIGCQLYVSFFSLYVKLLKNLSSPRILYIRSMVMTIVLIPLIIYMGDPIYFKNFQLQGFLVTRGIAGYLSVIGWYISIKILTLSEATILSLTSTFWLIIIEIAYLKIKIQKLQILCLAFCFIGIILICQPASLFKYFTSTTNSDEIHISIGKRLLGVALGLMSSFFNAVTQIIFGQLKGIVTPFVIFLYLVIFCQLLTPFLFYFDEDAKPITLNEWNILIQVGIYGIVSNLFNVRSFQLEKASIISIVGYSQLIFSYLIDIFILHHRMNNLSTIGSCMIFIFILILVRSKV